MSDLSSSDSKPEESKQTSYPSLKDTLLATFDLNRLFTLSYNFDILKHFLDRLLLEIDA